MTAGTVQRQVANTGICFKGVTVVSFLQLSTLSLGFQRAIETKTNFLFSISKLKRNR